MKIDKASFLLLAGALSSGACVFTSSGGGVDDDGAGGSGATGATGGSGGSGATGGSEGGAGGSGGGTCDDSVGTPADCTSNPTSCFEGFSGFCDVAADYFKPALAQQATECIAALGASGDDLADCESELACRDAAMAAACPEDVSIECAALVTECAGGQFPIDQAQCESILPAFTETGKAAVVAQCGPSTDGCLAGLFTDLLNCVDNMVPAN